MKICVVGDCILDSYVIGQAERLSPEGPFPAISGLQHSRRLGGAGNVALNCASLGSEVSLVTILGSKNADAAYGIRLICKNSEINLDALVLPRYTTVKERIIASGHQICRLDVEDTMPIADDEAEQLYDKIADINPDVIVVSDYAKGVVTPYMMDLIIEQNFLNGVPIIVDPKQAIEMYEGCTIMTPNLKEAKKLANADFDSTAKLANCLNRLSNSDILITLAEKGMHLYDMETNQHTHLPAQAHEVRSVVGLGDIVVASLAHYIAEGKSTLEAAKLANYAAGIASQKSYPQIFKEEMTNASVSAN